MNEMEILNFKFSDDFEDHFFDFAHFSFPLFYSIFPIFSGLINILNLLIFYLINIILLQVNSCNLNNYNKILKSGWEPIWLPPQK